MRGFPLVLLLLSTASALLPSSSPLKSRSSLRDDHGHRYRYQHSDEAAISVKSICGDAAVAADPQDIAQISRRDILRGALWTVTTGLYCGSGTISGASANTGTRKIISSSGRLVDQVIPDEKETYAEAQNGPGTQKRVLWVGPETCNGVFKNLFQAGNEVIALDLFRPDGKDLSAATTYATEHGYQLRFEQGDATDMKFADGTFDVVVSSMFLCQDFNPEVVVSEIRRVLKPGGRFGFYEHVEDIDKVVVGKVFGERSVIRVQAYPEKVNVIAGVVKKV